MKEKKLLIVTLLGMAFQVEAERSALREESDDTQEASKAVPEVAQDKDTKRRKFKETEDRNALHKRMIRKEGEHEYGKTMHNERRKAERKRKHDAYEEKDKKAHVAPQQHPMNLEAAERRDKARLKVEEQREQSLMKRRQAAEKKVSRLEGKLHDLEKKKREKMDERPDREGKVIPSHLINKTDNLADLNKDITDVKDRLKSREEQARKLSAEYKDENRDEYETRTILAKVYANEQRDLRRQLADVKDALALLGVEEKKKTIALADDREAYDAIHRDLRARKAMKDTEVVHKEEKQLGIRRSDDRVFLENKLERIRKDLDTLRMKMDKNDEGIDAAARRAGLEPRKEQKRKEDLDRYIKDGRENDTRLFSDKRRQIEDRKEDLKYAERNKAKKDTKDTVKPMPKKAKAQKKAA